MTTRLYFDHNIHGDIVKGLRGRSVDCLTSEEDGRDGLADELLLDRSIDLGRVMVSNDEDMLKIAQTRLATGGRFSGLIRIRQNTISVGQAIYELELLVAVIAPDEWRYRIEYLPM